MPLNNRPLSTTQNTVSPTVLPNLEKPPHASLSLYKQSSRLFEQPSLSPNQPLSNGVHRQTKQHHRSFCSRVQEGSSVLLPAVLSSATMANWAQNSGMGFESLPPLPITTVPFRFLKSLDLNSLGIGLNVVPSGFRWELVV